MELIRIFSIQQFQQYRKDWSLILERKHNTNPFIEFDWVNEWWKHLGSDQQIEMIIVQQEGKTIGFFPFLYEKRLFGYSYKFMAYGQANYMDFIAYADSLEVSIEYVFDEIIRRRKNVVFYLHGFLESSSTAEKLERYLQKREIQFSSHRVITPYIDLERIKLDEYMKKRKRLHRLDRREKRLRENGIVEVLKSSPKEMDNVFRLHDKRWEKKRDTSGFTNLKEKAFYRSLAGIQEGPLKTELDALYINDTMIAFNYGFNCRGRYLGYVLGYDDDFESFGPGRILEKEKILQCKYGNEDIFDLSIGYESYKFEWNTHLDYTMKIIFSSNTMMSKIHRSYLTAKESLIERIKQNHTVVLFVRNTIGKLLFDVKGFFRKKPKELTADFTKLIKRTCKYFYENERYIVYHVERKDILEIPISAEFVALTINDAMKVEEIAKKHMKDICRKMYGGYKGYYPKGDLSFENIFWTNDKVLRIDQIAYLEQFRKSTVHVKNSGIHNLSEVCSFIKENSKARRIYVTVEDGSRDEIILLEDMGFSVLKEINKRTYFGIEKHHICELIT